jgi:cytochrome c peroxidase
MRTTIWLIGTGLAASLAVSAAAQSLDPENVVQPENAQLHQAPQSELVAQGEALFNDPSIGESGLACANCHQNFGQYKETFKKPYPHFVNMAKAKAGLDKVNAAEMVQLCMVVPMQADPLPWESESLAALAAYVEDEQKRFAEQSQ